MSLRNVIVCLLGLGALSQLVVGQSILGCPPPNIPPSNASFFPQPWCDDKILPTLRLFRRGVSSSCLLNNNVLRMRGISEALLSCQRTSLLDLSKRVIFVVHGFQHDITEAWMTELKDLLLMANDADPTVVLVGWGNGAKLALWQYNQAAANTFTTGSYIGRLAGEMKRLGLAQSNLWCVGHSLGSHICGHAGKTTKFGRITGLDPAGPLFEDINDNWRLSPADADFVDAIHTCGKASSGLGIAFDHFGTLVPVGHIDFYPNGAGFQPGCSFTEIACSHGRAIRYYMESIVQGACRAKRRCSSRDKILSFCDVPVNPVIFGYHAKKNDAAGLYHIEMKSTRPHCTN